MANALRLLEKTELAMTEFAAGVDYHLKSVEFPMSTARVALNRVQRYLAYSHAALSN